MTDFFSSIISQITKKKSDKTHFMIFLLKIGKLSIFSRRIFFIITIDREVKMLYYNISEAYTLNNPFFYVLYSEIGVLFDFA